MIRVSRFGFLSDLRISDFGFSLLFLLFALAAGARAETFGEVTVTPQPLFSGEVDHGYIEHRYQAHNSSPTRSHQLTLQFPNRPWGGGSGSLRSLRRTVTLGPGASATLSLWQPDILMYGDKTTRVILDGQTQEATIPCGTSLNREEHRNIERVFLLSRNLNSDDLNSALSADSKQDLSPEAATGAPDGRNYSNDGWSPEYSSSGSEWIELEYQPPVAAEKIRLVYRYSSPTDLILTLKNAEGKEIGSQMLRLPRNSGFQAFTTNLTAASAPVASVRLEGRNLNNGILDAVGLVQSNQVAWAAQARASSSRASRSPGEKPWRIVRSEADPSSWSEHWLAYSPFDLILLTRRDAQAMPAPVLQAILRRVETGGSLAVLDASSLEDLPSGLGAITSQPRLSSPDGISTRFQVGLGFCLFTPWSDIQALGRSGMTALTNALPPIPWPQKGCISPYSPAASFPVIANLSLPVRNLSLLLLAFVLVIGPLNLFVLARLRRPIWMLWTIPAVSLLTTGGVFLYSFFSEGVTPTVRVEGLTLLDQSSHRATTLGLTAYYCPLTPSGGLRFSLDSEVTPIGNDSMYPSIETATEINNSVDQHFEHGWVTARIPTCYGLRKSETRRERLEVEQGPDGQVTVVNGLGANIQSLWLKDARGQLHHGTALPAGKRAVLTQTPDGFDWPTSPLPDSWRGSLARAMQDPAAPESLRPNAYMAVLEGAPFLEPALARRAHKTERSVVYGLFPTGVTP